MIEIHTNKGPIKVKLDYENTLMTSKNFLSYIRARFYEGTIFHRVIDNFMIQGGGHGPDMARKTTGLPIENEAEHAMPNKKGTIAMARTGDPHSATSQFFINIADNEFLNFKKRSTDGWGYCVFGEVIEGLDVVDAIKSVETGKRKGHSDVPVEDIIIERIEILEEPVEQVEEEESASE